MRLVSAYNDGTPIVGRLDGDTVIIMAGADQLGARTPTNVINKLTPSAKAPVSLTDVQLRPVIPHPGKIICVGLNYIEHVEESKRDIPEYPVLFAKYKESLIGPNDPIVKPAETSQLDFEGELAVIIGTAGRRIPEDEALNHVMGYTISNDVTMRDFQYKTHQWIQGKSWEKSTPIGPYLLTPDEFDLDHATIRTTLNGEVVQDSDLSMLMFSVPRLISTISEFVTLEPGDVILTGTPGGVGFRREPKLFMSPGDQVTVAIGGLGTLANIVVDEKYP